MKTILLTDSDTEFLRNIAEYLNRLGYAVIAMQNGSAALSVIREGMPIDLVITDYHINGMNGLEMLTAIKKIVPSMPMIVVTADTFLHTYLKAVSLGVFEYLSKPVKPHEIGGIVKGAFE